VVQFGALSNCDTLCQAEDELRT